MADRQTARWQSPARQTGRDNPPARTITTDRVGLLSLIVDSGDKVALTADTQVAYAAVTVRRGGSLDQARTNTTTTTRHS